MLALLFARFLVKLKATVMVVVVWLCHDVGCGLVVLWVEEKEKKQRRERKKY